MRVVDLQDCSVGAFNLRQEFPLSEDMMAPDGRRISDGEVLVFEPYPEVIIDLSVSWREGRPFGRVVWIIVDAPSGATVYGRPMADFRATELVRQARQEGIRASGGIEGSPNADDVALSDDIVLAR